ncbi:MAG: tetratricopeptide repeat protein [Deltaproteobacteria bacterium]|nr:tetratricopeptide repeat protein [Deltaproteobacteria bacterium]MBW2257723.1 tetratricopeptide repeat protein [Deltaproteobacteria bacterium]
MDQRAEAAREIAALFGDGGAHLLSEADLGSSWADAFANVPPTVFSLRGQTEHPVGERLLAAVRDFWSRAGQLRPAMAATRALLRLRAERLGGQHPDTLLELGALGALAGQAGRSADAGPMLEEAWQGLRSTVGGRNIRVAMVAEQVGLHYLRTGEYQKADMALEQSHRIRSELAPGSQGGVAAQLGELRLGMHQVDEALPLLEEAYQLLREQLGPTDPRTIDRARSLAHAYTRAKDNSAAEPLLRDLHAYALQTGDEEQIAEAAFEVGVVLLRQGYEEEGFRRVEESIRLTRHMGDPHPALASRLSTWVRLLLPRRHVEEAEGILREAIEAERILHGADSPRTAVRYVELGELLAELGRADEAMGWLDPAVSILRSTVGDEHEHTHRAVENLGYLLLMQARQALSLKDRGTARELKRHAISLVPILGEDHEVVKGFLALEV